MGKYTPVWLSSYGVKNLVSVLVSVADPKPQLPLLLKQFGLEARVGIGRLKRRYGAKNARFYW